MWLSVNEGEGQRRGKSGAGYMIETLCFILSEVKPHLRVLSGGIAYHFTYASERLLQLLYGRTLRSKNEAERQVSRPQQCFKQEMVVAWSSVRAAEIANIHHTVFMH